MTNRRPSTGSTATGTGSRSGFALVDLAIVVAILLTLLTPALPFYAEALHNAKQTLAVRSILEIQASIECHRSQTGALPGSLHELEAPPGTDPCGKPFEYRLESEFGRKGRGRMDRFLRPLNTDYDLFSRGPDGHSASPLTAEASRDDTLRAGNGRFVGPARDYR